MAQKRQKTSHIGRIELIVKYSRGPYASSPSSIILNDLASKTRRGMVTFGLRKRTPLISHFAAHVVI